jgi:hypothetical protein
MDMAVEGLEVTIEDERMWMESTTHLPNPKTRMATGIETKPSQMNRA